MSSTAVQLLTSDWLGGGGGSDCSPESEVWSQVNQTTVQLPTSDSRWRGVRLQSRIWSTTAVKILKHNCSPPCNQKLGCRGRHKTAVPWDLCAEAKYILFLYVNVPPITGLRGGGMALLTWGLWWCCRSGECVAVVVLVLLGEACTVSGVTLPCWRRWCGESDAIPGNCDEVPGNCGYGWLPGRNGLVKPLLLLLLTTTRTKKRNS